MALATALYSIAMEVRMRTLKSAAVPPPKTRAERRNHVRAMRETRDAWRRMLSCRPIIKRMATREELARIREELKAAAEAGHTCTLSARSVAAAHGFTIDP